MIRNLLLIALTAFAAASSSAVPVSLTKLTGLTGGTAAGTAVYKADLTAVGISMVLSVGISDNSIGIGGAPGQFSGFDLDAIKLSTTNCADAACAKALVGLNVFDFGAGTAFTAGAQRATADAKLFGTNGGGNAVDNTVATLADFDGESSTVTPGGFLSMGDNGVINFNLTSALSTAGLYLYIGEVGDNGEVAAGSIVVRDATNLPEPATAALVALGLLGACTRRGRYGMHMPTAQR